MSNPFSYLGISDAAYQQATASGANPFRYLGISDEIFYEAAKKLGYSTPSTPTSSTPTLGLRKVSTLTSSSSTPSTRSACDVYASAVAAGQKEAILAPLRVRCNAEKLTGGYTQGGASVGGGSSAIEISSGGALPEPDSRTSVPSSAPGLSPVVIGAIAVAVGVVGFVAYSRLSKKKGKR